MKQTCGFLVAILPFLFGSSVQAAEPAAAHAVPAPAAAHGAAAPAAPHGAAGPGAAHGAPPTHGARDPLIGPALGPRLAGHTISVVAFVPRRPGAPGGGQLSRLIVQAYLGPDGRSLVRVWDASRNAYTAPAARPWTLTGSTLCLDVPAPGNGPMCADVHVWGPRIAGVGVQPSYAMLDGDLKPGNVIGGRR
jgi:hypothetical protein